MKYEAVEDIVENAALGRNKRCLNVKSIVFMVLGLWFGLIAFLAAQGAFIGRSDSPPLPILFAFVIPLVAFFAAYFGWSKFRAFILGADLRLVAAMQAWRWAGLGFLSLYAHGILPGLFAFPAGLGDMAVGISAPWIMLKLVNHPSFAASRRFVIWNVLGITDFIVAMSIGVVCSGFFHGITGMIGNISTASMAQLPLVLIPAYMVPFFCMLHFTALLQARQLPRSGKSTPGFHD